MIVKSISWKTPGFHELLKYVTEKHKIVGTPITQNLPVRDAADLRSVQRAFLANARHLPPRKNGVILYHEILSFSPADREHLTPEILTDLADHYLALRAAEALAYGTVHMERNHPHIHVVISGNLIRQEKKLRLSRPQFAGVKRAIEAYQQERYPELSHSLVQPEPDQEQDPNRKRRKTRNLRNSPSRLATAAHRQEERGVLAPETAAVREAVDQAFLVSFSPAEFSRSLQVAGISLALKQGRVTGVTAAGTAYPFPQLGYPEEVFSTAEKAWQIVAKRLRTLDNDATEKTRTLLRRFGYADELLAVLERTGSDPLSPYVRERLSTIERDAEEKRLHYRRTHTGLGRRKEYSEI
jgi:hypothetical protein